MTNKPHLNMIVNICHTEASSCNISSLPWGDGSLKRNVDSMKRNMVFYVNKN